MRRQFISAKQQAYDLAALIEAESQQKLVAVPCNHGSAIAVYDGKKISLVNCGEIATPQALRSYVAERMAAGTSNLERSSSSRMRFPSSGGVVVRRTVGVNPVRAKTHPGGPRLPRLPRGE